jgi:hypothetical protein
VDVLIVFSRFFSRRAPKEGRPETPFSELSLATRLLIEATTVAGSP